SQWAEGSYVRDVQAVRIPEDWNADKAVFYLGFWKDDPSLANAEQRLAVVGPSDGRRRARAATVAVSAP
ncbi:MAG TPA: hypothetical protein VFZ61_12180, partial [Polyangiales bacterium]